MMEIPGFIQVLQEITEMFDEMKTDFSSRLKTKSIPRNFVFHQAGVVSDCLFFVEKGLVRHYYFHRNKELTIWFSKEGEIIADSSFLNRKPGRENLQCLEDSTLSYLHYKDFEELLQLYPELERLGRLLFTHLYIGLEEHFADTILLTAQERYELLMHQYPDFIKRIPLGYLSSFLNICPETLSRIRKKTII